MIVLPTTRMPPVVTRSHAFFDAAARHIRDETNAWIAIGFGLLFVCRDLDNPPGDRFGPFFRNGEKEISQNARLWHDISLDDSRPRPVLDGGEIVRRLFQFVVA